MVKLRHVAIAGVGYLLLSRSTNGSSSGGRIGHDVQSGSRLTVKRVGDSFFGGADYSITVSETIGPLADVESGDSFVGGATVNGRIQSFDEKDVYAFSGEIVSADIPHGLAVFVDGKQVI